MTIIFSVESKHAKKMFQAVQFALCQYEARRNLEGISFTYDCNTLEFTTSDSFNIAYSKTPVLKYEGLSQSGEFTISPLSINNIKQILKNSSHLEIKIEADNKVYFNGLLITLSEYQSVLISCKRFQNIADNNRIKVNAAQFYRAVKFLNYKDDNLLQVLITENDKNTIQIKTHLTEEKTVVPYSGTIKNPIQLNAAFLCNHIKSVKTQWTDTINFIYDTIETPAFFYSSDSLIYSGISTVLLPCKIQ